MEWSSEKMNNAEIKKSLNYFIEQYFREIEDISSGEVIKVADSGQIEKLAKMGIPERGRNVQEVMEEMMADVYDHRARLNHPRYLGFIPGPASLNSWVGEVMTSAYNLHAGSWMSTSAASYIEKVMIEWLSKKVGYHTAKSGGLFVSGGSMANLTALVAARDKKLSFGSIHLGIAYVSEQTHSSIKKALKIAGISPKHIRRIGVDSQYRMNMEELEEVIKEDVEEGLQPFVIIASAGTTNTGSVDPMEAVHKLCEKYNMWMHVDGAFGASILLAENYRYLLQGIEYADSLSWDAHKWLFQTYGCGIVLVKEKKNLARSFHTNPEYLRDLEINDDEINYWDIGMELTRPARGLKFWFTLQTMGSGEISRRIEWGIHLAEYAKELLGGLNNWQVVSEPQLAIINFRYVPSGFSEQEIDELNSYISQLAVQDNYTGVFTTVLNDQVVLRICSINPSTTEADIEQTVAKLDDFAKYLLSDNAN